jgi:hypothetical protein
MKATIDYFAFDYCLSNGIAKAVVCMGISVRVDGSAINEVGFAIDANSKVAALSLQAQPALATGGIYHH